MLTKNGSVMLAGRVPLATESAFEEICKQRRMPKGALVRLLIEDFLAKNNAALSIGDKKAA